MISIMQRRTWTSSSPSIDANVMRSGRSMIQDGTSTPFQAHTDQPSGYRSAGPLAPCSRPSASPRSRSGRSASQQVCSMGLQPAQAGRQLPTDLAAARSRRASRARGGYNRKRQATTARAGRRRSRGSRGLPTARASSRTMEIHCGHACSKDRFSSGARSVTASEADATSASAGFTALSTAARTRLCRRLPTAAATRRRGRWIKRGLDVRTIAARSPARETVRARPDFHTTQSGPEV